MGWGGSGGSAFTHAPEAKSRNTIKADVNTRMIILQKGWDLGPFDPYTPPLAFFLAGKSFPPP
jgi:hypothetical protein